MRFCDNLQHLRTTHNMTQEQLAMRLGVSRQAVSKWESVHAYPEMDKLLMICTLFDCQLDDLVRGDLTHHHINKTMRTPQGEMPQDITDYDKAMRVYAFRLPIGVSIMLFGIALTILWLILSAALKNKLPNYTAVVLCAGTMVGAAFIVSGVYIRNRFQKTHPFVKDFYTAKQRDEARAAMFHAVILGFILVVTGVLAAIFLHHVTLLAWAVFLLFFAVSVFYVLHRYFLWRRMDIEKYNQRSFSLMTEQEINALDDIELQKVARKAKCKRNVCMIIMYLATIISLCLLFIPQFGAYRWFWLAWVVGGILCAATNLYIDIRREK